jgi:hypothetical protein
LDPCARRRLLAACRTGRVPPQAAPTRLVQPTPPARRQAELCTKFQQSSTRFKRPGGGRLVWTAKHVSKCARGPCCICSGRAGTLRIFPTHHSGGGPGGVIAAAGRPYGHRQSSGRGRPQVRTPGSGEAAATLQQRSRRASAAAPRNRAREATPYDDATPAAPPHSRSRSAAAAARAARVTAAAAPSCCPAPSSPSSSPRRRR